MIHVQTLTFSVVEELLKAIEIVHGKNEANMWRKIVAAIEARGAREHGSLLFPQLGEIAGPRIPVAERPSISSMYGSTSITPDPDARIPPIFAGMQVGAPAARIDDPPLHNTPEIVKAGRDAMLLLTVELGRSDIGYTSTDWGRDDVIQTVEVHMDGMAAGSLPVSVDYCRTDAERPYMLFIEGKQRQAYTLLGVLQAIVAFGEEVRREVISDKLTEIADVLTGAGRDVEIHRSATSMCVFNITIETPTPNGEIAIGYDSRDWQYYVTHDGIRSRPLGSDHDGVVALIAEMLGPVAPPLVQ